MDYKVIWSDDANEQRSVCGTRTTREAKTLEAAAFGGRRCAGHRACDLPFSILAAANGLTEVRRIQNARD